MFGVLSPYDCPAVSGDGYCTHVETPVSTPIDCPVAEGDGYSWREGTSPSKRNPTAASTWAVLSKKGKMMAFEYRGNDEAGYHVRHK